MAPFRRSLCGLVSLVSFFLAAPPTEAATAAKPFITVSPSWRPPKQLTTIDVNGNGVTDPGDDIRYAAIDIFVTTNVEFSAFGFTCTVNRLALESYVPNGDPNSTDDSAPMLADGADWVTAFHTTADTTDIDGKLNFAISVTAPYLPPMGQEGVTKTVHVATVRYRVKEGLSGATTSPFNCTSAFYDWDAAVLPKAKSLAVPPLGIVPGYSVTGKLTYQGITAAPTAAQAIGVLCDDSDGDAIFDDAVTTASPTTGLFRIDNLRTPGRYDCQFLGNIVAPGAGPDLHLRGVTDFDLETANLALLPVALRSGNVNRTAGSATLIDGNDLTMVTSNWNVPQALPFQTGDANGDRKVNEADLALVGSNFATVEPVRAHHLIYSLPRDDYAFQNSRLWSGGMNSAFVRRFVSGTGRDYWPAVSPDGARIAFVRNVGPNGTDKFALFVAPLANGIAGVAKRITAPGDTYDAFAPAWSPDGSQLAFVCSYDHAWFDGSSPAGHLCLIDGNGRNFRLVEEANLKRPLPVKIQSPSWFNGQIIFFAYDKEPGIVSSFDNRVAFLTLPNYVMSGSSNVPTNSDMPGFRETVMGPTLFYRFDDGAGSRTIRFAQTNATGGVPGSYPNTTPGTLHGDVGGSSSVDYFTVSTGGDPHVFFYTSNPATGTAGGNTFFIRVFSGTATAPVWFPVTVVSYGVSNGLGNPEFTSPYHDVLRNTAAFVP